MANAIRLTVEKSNWLIDGLPEGYRLKITASDSTFQTDAIFRFRKIQLQPGEDEYTIVCDGVCSTADLAEFPEFDSRENDDFPYFRNDYCDFIFRSRATAEAAFEVLLDEVTVLITGLDLLENTVDITEIEVGELPTGSSSSEAS